VDLTDVDAARGLLAKTRPRLIYHLAGMVSARQDRDFTLPMLHANLIGTVHLLLAASETGCQRMVLLGSSEEPIGAAGDEIAMSPYAAAKVAGTLYARMFWKLYGLPVVVTRPFVTYGPRQEPTKLIPYTILSLLRGEAPQLSSGSRIADFVYVLDVVRGLLWAGLRPGVEGKTIDLGTGTGTTVREVVELLVELSGSAARPVFGALPDRPGERRRVADTEAARRHLGWLPLCSLREGLAQTVAWYRSTVVPADGRR
jgi:nucleoside-diphosphate-sugar epimerase